MDLCTVEIVVEHVLIVFSILLTLLMQLAAYVLYT